MAWAPKDWRLSVRMAIVLMLPLVLAVSLAAPRIKGSLEQADRMAREEKVAGLVLSATELAHALENERDAAASGKRAVADDVGTLRAATDRVLAEYYRRSSVEGTAGGLGQRLKEAERALRGLSSLRMRAFTALSPVATETAYSGIITPLLGLTIEAGFASGSDGRALYALSVGQASVSSQRALLNAAFTRGRALPKETTAVVAQEGLQGLVFKEFQSAATPEDRGSFAHSVNPDRLASLVRKAVGTPPAVLGGALMRDWHSTADRVLDGLHRLEMRIAERILGNAVKSQSEARHKAVMEGSLVGAALLLAVGLAALIVRSTVKKLRKLRGTALRAARQQLPELVTASTERHPGRVVPQPVVIDLGTRDEVGDVSRAFAAVFDEAVKQAGEQAELRASVGTMLASMARRSQTLVHRQLEVISELERTEADPDKLKRLFRADHLATRMRRYGENLLVLAGESPGRIHQEPASLLDVVRAAGAEVERFDRIQVLTLPETSVLGPVVHDLTHLLAELLDNAIQYSDRTDGVAVSSRITLAGDLVIEVDDNGVGIDADEMDRLNEILERTPVMDAEMTRCMGMYVVSRLASKHDVQVQLRSVGKGCTAVVTVPARMLAAAPDGVHGQAPHVPRVAEKPPAYVPAQRSAPGQATLDGPPANRTPDRKTKPAAPMPVTPHGLPRRVPRASLNKDAETTGPLGENGTAPQPGRTPEELQQRMASFRGGSERGRQESVRDTSDNNDELGNGAL
ncbi:nitrate- and nitrite sensing domain-containing protein [Streptomyces sp. AV19]|uniref:sensor histidine kinase n=1 Tax=Streptomyces sp. AV19 TaxID=2793068 RepID=UPI0018FE7B33|nr:nitrate- and nitrite sensing domain-containing protein [Streptomyces sp. AV19]MBH1939175.1 nitrate- and nitrite sensing domain-containing protein [Streptomyces sp. AV19]MDG4536905.1 nitrate- and nitrite sensing domain-containing protein [Streptomyces sp. AV19]